MADNILKVLKPQSFADHEALLQAVEKWVQDRRSDGSRLAGIAIVSVQADGTISTFYDGGDKHFALLGAVAELQHRMVSE